MKTFGQILQEHRKAKGLLARDIAEQLGIDATLISRFESGRRLPTEEQVHAMAAILDISEKKLMVSWLSQRIINEVSHTPYAIEALKAAEESVRYGRAAKTTGYSASLKSLLKEADLLKKELNTFRHLDSFRIAEALELEYTYHSNRIEGNTLTLQETELVVQHGLTISGKSMREHLEAINHSDAIAFVHELVKSNKTLTERQLLQIHQLVLRGIDRENAGCYRKVQVRIGGSSHIPPDAWHVPVQMEELFRWYRSNAQLHPVVLAAEMHEKLVSIHPFIDGNGRTSRLLMNLILLQNGFVIANLKGDKTDRLHYYNCLEQARNNNKEAFITLIAETEIRCLGEYLRILKGN